MATGTPNNRTKSVVLLPKRVSVLPLPGQGVFPFAAVPPSTPTPKPAAPKRRGK